MAQRRFVHLHCHSHYSLLDGANRIPELVRRTRELGMNALALTDHGNLYGAIEFYRECRDAGINPIVGYEAYVAPGKRTEREARRRGDAGYHLTLLARDLTGFKNLVKMASAAFLDGYHYVPRIDKELLEAHHEGLICLSGCASSEFSEFILKDQRDEAERVAEWFARLFGEHFYVEIQNNGLEIQKLCAEGAVDIANRKGWPLVATCDAHYLCQDDAFAHEVLLAINTGKKLSDEKRMSYGSDQFYVQGPEEMYRRFPAYADAVARSQQIADGVDIRLDFKKRHFPVFTPPSGKNAEQYLRQLAHEGLVERYGEPPPQAAVERLEHELSVICRMGFAGYFLIVWDFVRFARERGIPCSARGSGCGAITCYVLKISHVCPLEYDLLFERFMDPNRNEAPDIDIDFCQERREDVIEYVKQKYGASSVAQICTFGTMAAKAALKDVGRVLDIPLDRVNAITKLVPARLGATLDDAMNEVPEFRKEYESDALTRKWFDVAMKLEGTNRQAGIHAAGVVIANGPITDYVPVHRAMRKGEDNGQGARASLKAEPVVATQWVMGDLEKVGLLKMDFLGLRTLTVIDNAVKLIEKTRGEKLDVYNLPMDDAETYQLLQKGAGRGVFQLESEGIRELLKRMKPDNIRDLIAIMALYRPGPLQGGMVDSYVNRKHGRETWSYPNPVLKEVLDETYGVMCIHEGARVSLADGSEKPIRDVRRGDVVHSLDLDTNRFEAKECHGCGPTRREDGLRISLENGYAVTLTDDHKVWTYGGWKEARDLDPAVDLVAIGLSTPQAETTHEPLAPWLGNDADVAYLIGYLVGDGCLTGCGVTVATGTARAHDRFMSWCGGRLPKLSLHPYYHQRSWYVSISCGELLEQPGYGNRKTRWHHFVESLGLKKPASEKRVPARILRAPSDVRAAFLAGLLDSDACFATNQRGVAVAFLTSASPALLDDVCRLARSEGVAVHRRVNRVHFWDTRRLSELLEPHLVLKAFRGALRRGASIGWVPRARLLAAIPGGESRRAFCSRTGIQRAGLVRRHPFVKSSTAAKARIDLGHVRYLRISAVERVKDQQFYGMSVADHHNLVANGIVVKNCYQEQIMRILNRLGGIELSSAYACIKAISKKKKDIIDQRQIDFVNGAQERGLTAKQAEEIFGLIVFFAGYGFNKAHTAAYAQLGYQTAYLKRHYTPEFMASLLSSEIDDGNKRDILVEHIADARALGVEVLPPDVNAGEPDFTVRGGKIVFGLTAIKGLGRGAAEAIVRARTENGPFRDLYDFCERVDARSVARMAIEKMIKAGAFDRFGPRAALMQVLPRAAQAAEEKQQDRKRGQRSFFDVMDGGGNGDGAAEPLPDVPEWPETERLKYEKEALDFYMSSHPLAQYDTDLRRYASHTAEQARRLDDGTEVRIGGMMTQVRYFTSKKSNKRYVRCKVEDFTGAAECVMWPDSYERFAEMFVDDRIVLAQATVERMDRDEPVFVLSKVFTIEQARRELTTAMLLRMSLAEHAPDHVEALARVLRRAPGPCRVELQVTDGAGRRARLRLGESFKVDPAKLALEELEMILGPGGVVFTGR